MGWTVTFVIIFGIAAVIPATWSIVGLARGETRFWPCVVGTGWAIVLLLITLVEIGTDWGGCGATTASSKGAITCCDNEHDPSCIPDVWAQACAPHHSSAPRVAFCPHGQKPMFDFCEPIQLDSAVKQPAATWSDLSFVAAGLWLLWFFRYFAREGSSAEGTTFISATADNPMITIGWLSVAYGLIVIFMGPPSMWFHASMKDWAGWFDSMSVVFWLGFNAIYVLYTLCFAMWGNGRGWQRPLVVLIAWGVLAAALGAIAATSLPRIIVYLISGGLWGIAEVVYVFVAALASGVVYRRTWWLFVINLALLALTMGIWVVYNHFFPSVCRQVEGFPGHALFHILASFSTVLTFFSFASEQRVSD